MVQINKFLNVKYGEIHKIYFAVLIYQRFYWATNKEPLTYYDMNLSAQVPLDYHYLQNLQEVSNNYCYYFIL